MKKKTLLLLMAGFFMLILRAAGQGTTRSASLLALENEIKTLQQDDDLKNAVWAFYVTDIKAGKVVVSYNADLSLAPASVMKVVTTATALALLDSSFTFDTRLQYTGSIDSITGVLHGDLYLTGGGDPTLGSKRFGEEVRTDSVFAQFMRAIKDKGIHSVDGYLIGDESIFEYMVPGSWQWEDVGNYYGSNACGLSVNENMYRLYFNSALRDGDPPELVKVEPPLPGVRFVNNVKTLNGTKGDNVFIMGGPYSYLRILEGSMPMGKKNFDVDGALPDPAMYCTRLCEQYMKNNGITVAFGATTVREENWKEQGGHQDTAKRIDLSVYHSPKLSDIVYFANLKSINLYAEAILRIIGYKIHDEGTVKAGVEAVRSYWSSKTDLSGFAMYDGSGLSRKDLITAKQLCQILTSFYSNPEFIPFLHSLPVAGESGTLRNHLKGTAGAGNVMAKSGTMDAVRSYAGYVTSKAGKDYAFAILMNNYTCPNWAVRQKCDRLMELIVELE